MTDVYMDFQLSKFVNLWNYAFQIYLLQLYFCFPFKLAYLSKSVVYLGNLRKVNSQGCNLLRLRKNNFPECVFGLNIIFELFPFVDITRTSYYISINFNFIFLNLIENTLSRTKSALVHHIGHYILSHTV